MEREPSASSIAGGAPSTALRARAARWERPARPRAPASAAVLTAAGALVASRALVWASGVGAAVTARPPAGSGRYDPAHLTEPFSALGNLLVAPAARWDAVWYLAIAHDGYPLGSAGRAAFFPLYPLLARAAGGLWGSALLGGMAVSLAALACALWLVHRLAALELGPAYARPAVLLVAFSPVSLFFSAVYSEALFLALSLGAFYAARRSRWGWAGVLGGLAAATRSAGVLLVAGLGALALEQRRRRGSARGAGWLVLVPLGLGAYLAALGLAGHDVLEPFRAQALWQRHLRGPLEGAWAGIQAGGAGGGSLLAGHGSRAGAEALVLALSLAGGLLALAGALRRLPPAYGLYAGLALLLPLSYPAAAQPLMSLPRFEAVLFPLWLWLARWATDRRVLPAVLLASGLGLALLTTQFATWRWVA